MRWWHWPPTYFSFLSRLSSFGLICVGFSLQNLRTFFRSYSTSAEILATQHTSLSLSSSGLICVDFSLYNLRVFFRSYSTSAETLATRLTSLSQACSPAPGLPGRNYLIGIHFSLQYQSIFGSYLTLASKPARLTSLSQACSPAPGLPGQCSPPPHSLPTRWSLAHHSAGPRFGLFWRAACWSLCDPPVRARHVNSQRCHGPQSCTAQLWLPSLAIPIERSSSPLSFFRCCWPFLRLQVTILALSIITMVSPWALVGPWVFIAWP